MEMQANVAANPINPMLLFSELSPKLPDNAIITTDSGTSASWYARQLNFRGQMRGSLSGNLASMGPGVPYGIGAKFGTPDRPVIVFAGDGDAIGRAWERALSADRPTVLDVIVDPDVPALPSHATFE